MGVRRDVGRGTVRAVLVLVVLSACASGPQGSPTTSPTATPTTSTTASPNASATIAVRTQEYLPGLAADVRLPSGTGPAPLVVLVPGGGWQSADRSGLAPLAGALAAGGAVTVTITYGTASTGAQFPVPADDVACAIRWAAATAASDGRTATDVVVLGHSAGGHLAALVGLSGDRFGGACASPPVRVDGVVGLAGVYDVSSAATLIAPFFAAPRATAPQDWRDGDPLWWATDGSAVSATGPRTLLVHGDADPTVPLAQSTSLASALEGRSAPVQVEVLPGGDHFSVLDAGVVAPLVLAWLAG